MNKSIQVFIALAMLTTITSLVACEEIKKEKIQMAENDKISSEEWKLLTQKRIVFGHQSVGNNILAGVQELAKQAGVNLPIVEPQNAGASPGISHFKIGQNDDPYSKIKDFEKTLETGTANVADIAMMKLCYIDFNSETDAIKLARDYSESYDRLSQKFPKTLIIAVTTPLTTVQSGPKAWVKRLLGKNPSGYVENYKRKEFNDFLRKRFSEPGRLFDLAKYESTGAGTYVYKDRPIEVLNTSITNDGGHLNHIGSLYIASKMIKFIAGLPR